MRDAIGGTFSIQIILFFLIVINSYLAFSVNYTKAFRIKNNIVAIIEQQEGYTMGNTLSEEERTAEERVFALMNDANYTIDKSSLRCNEGYTQIYSTVQNTGFCLQLHKNVDGSGYYSIMTYVNIDIPILKNILPVFSQVFAIKGETKTIYSNKLVDLE